MPSPRVLLWACVLLVRASAGCYRAMPLSPAAVEQALAPPSLDAIRVQAQALQHPILRPIEFDERDGLFPDEAVVLAVLANPSLRAVRDQRGIAKTQIIQAGILPNPSFSGGAELPIKAPEEADGCSMGFGWDFARLIALGTHVEAAKAQARPDGGLPLRVPGGATGNGRATQAAAPCFRMEPRQFAWVCT